MTEVTKVRAKKSGESINIKNWQDQNTSVAPATAPPIQRSNQAASTRTVLGLRWPRRVPWHTIQCAIHSYWPLDPSWPQHYIYPNNHGNAMHMSGQHMLRTSFL